MTALVIVITGAYNNPEFTHFVEGNQGAALTSAAMGQKVFWFPYILAVAVSLFAFSTMTSWFYYGDECKRDKGAPTISSGDGTALAQVATTPLESCCTAGLGLVERPRGALPTPSSPRCQVTIAPHVANPLF